MSATNMSDPKPKTTRTNGSTKTEAESSEEISSLADAIEQIRAATNEMYSAFSSLSSAGGQLAKEKLGQGKKQAMDFESRIEETASEKPLLYIGAAFAAGWLVSRLMK